jgi:hypothetical protein
MRDVAHHAQEQDEQAVVDGTLGRHGLKLTWWLSRGHHRLPPPGGLDISAGQSRNALALPENVCG